VFYFSGESYYEASTNPSLYFQMLLLTGQYEAALEFLVRTPRLRCHGVHMAIALLKTGYLAVTGNRIVLSCQNDTEKSLFFPHSKHGLILYFIDKLKFTNM
jgi:Nup93/Nic96.